MPECRQVHAHEGKKSTEIEKLSRMLICVSNIVQPDSTAIGNRPHQKNVVGHLFLSAFMRIRRILSRHPGKVCDHSVPEIIFSMVRKGRGGRLISSLTDRLSGWQIAQPPVQDSNVEGIRKPGLVPHVDG